MTGRRTRGCLLVLVAAALAPRPSAAQPPRFDPPATYRPTVEELTPIRARLADLDRALAGLGRGVRPARLADAAVFRKAAEWALRHGDFYDRGDVAATLHVLDRGLDRVRELAAGKPSWVEAKGRSARGFVSKVDGSIQLYAIEVPAAAPDGGRYRLDVVLHGRDDRLSEVRFLREHDGRPAPDAGPGPGLVLHVYGRGNNAYRWAGETDVFEAIDAVRRDYPVDEGRIVLRGFSMGGAGAWHLGLHHPARWCAVEAGAGFTDTKNYLGRADFPAYQEKALHIYDAADYARNACDVPIASYAGELDRQLRAPSNVRDALAGLGFAMKTEGSATRAEGLDFLMLVGARTGHAVDPESAARLKAFRDEHAAAPREPTPKSIRFATYTLKYNRAAWLTVERLTEHYKRATVDATLADDVVRLRAENVAILGITRGVGERVEVDGQVMPLRAAVKGLLPEVYYRKLEDRWEVLDYDQSRALQENARAAKRPGLQGPIDDAFTAPFLCVRGTSRPWSPQVQSWAEARLKAFQATWSRSMRGDLRVKDDRDVTPEDVERYHLVLFGDPGSNTLIDGLRKDLPLRWSREQVELGGAFPAADHVPVLIAPNPRNPLRYIVLNSGHTFGPEAFAGSNALLYPRLGDYAVLRAVGGKDDVRVSGYFDESWKLPK